MHDEASAPEELPPETVILVRRAQTGDRQALNELALKYRPHLIGFVRPRIGRELQDHLDDSDVVQSVFGEALGSLHTYSERDNADFFDWLAEIARHKISEKLRSVRADKRDAGVAPLRGSAADDLFAKLPGSVPSPSQDVQRKEDSERFLQAMQELRPDYREVIQLVQLDGLSHKEAGARMNCSEGASRERLSRALVELMKSIIALRGGSE